MSNLKPLKRLGQNFLKDNNVIQKIIQEINPDKKDFILEIGPGNGALTEYLSQRTDNFYAIEIDKKRTSELKLIYPVDKIIHDNFLRIDLNHFFELGKTKLRIVGNIPYNITSSILFKVIENHEIISDIVLMVQYEVAKRMTSIKGSKDYGILSVILKMFFDTTICFEVSPNCFHPKPNVNSAIIHLVSRGMLFPEVDKKKYISIVKASFGNRRKTLKNSLNNSIFNEYDFSSSGVDLSKRAEELDIIDFVKLSQILG